ncbi:MAG: HEAT repeat domain-containing protein [Burkholderiales bacterium]|nr:HEAT repeat domain-containing protein [Burkholderiales bacterium]
MRLAAEVQPGAGRGAAPGDRATVLGALRNAAAGADEVSRCHAVRALARIDARDAGSIDVLLGALGDPDPDVRIDAVAAVGRLGLAAAVAPLVEMLEADPAGAVRAEAARALGHIAAHGASERALDALIRCFLAEGYPDADDPAGEGGHWLEVHSRTLEALGAIGDARAAAPIIEMLEHGDCEDFEESAYRVLARLDAAQAEQYLVRQLRAGGRLARRRAARALAGARGGLAERLVQPLLEAFLDADPAVRIEAARALAAGGAPGAHVPLTLLLGDAQAQVRGEVARLLGRARGASALDRLHALLADPDAGVRRAVAAVLGEIADERSAAAFGMLLDAEDALLRQEAIRALGAIGRPGFEDKLAAVLRDTDSHHALRGEAARALGRLLRQGARDPASIELLARYAEDHDESVAQAALAALAEAGADGVAGRLAEIVVSTGAAPALRRLAARLLGDRGALDERGTESLRAACGAQDAALRREALLALGRAGGPRAAAFLVPGLRDESASVRLAALEALGCQPPAHDLGERLAALCDDPDAGVRGAALRALAEAHGAAATPRLCRALADESPHVCRAALRLLAARGLPPECRAAVVETMFRFAGALREEAAAALRRAGDGRASAALLAVLADPGREERHWIALDALGALHAVEAMQ